MRTSAARSSGGFQDQSAYLEKPTIMTLNANYTDGDSADQEIFSEMRSNILLASGDHYNRNKNRFYKRIRDNRELNDQQKLRLTKNHVQKICKIYANNIISMNPGVGFTPKDENSNHDQKVAEIHHSVWQDAMHRYHLDERMDEWCDSFVQVGELAVKLFWDPFAGNHLGYEPMANEMGEPELDELGEMMPNEDQPIFEGAFIFEEVYGFNLLRPSDCKDMRKAEWLCIRKMVDTKELKCKLKKRPQLQEFVKTDSDETYKVFDAMSGGYRKTNNQTMVREYYYRPSMLFPNGYFYITTQAGILDEGELPGGLFPIVFTAWDKIQTTPRGRSAIKVMRPYQAEINRSASKIAEHQVTLGDDKLLIQNGTKVSAGASLPGIRSVNYTGAEPKVLAGRTGEQYLNYMTSQIAELYQVMMVAEDMAEVDMKMDPYVLLFRSAKQKKKFQRYIKRFEKFLIELCELYLRLAKIHLPDDAVIWAIGKSEQVNIPEFRELSDTCYEVKIEGQADDIETKFGKQIVLNHALQFVGPQMKPDDIGKIMRQMPFANFDESFDDMTVDYDSVKNDMLALDRGERPPVGQYDNHVYNIKMLSLRTRKADFRFTPPAVQQNYFMKIQMHQEMEAKNQIAIQRANAGFIPTDGALIPVDFYVDAPNSTGGVKQVKVKLPYFALDWLVKQLEAQGASQQKLADMNSGQLAQLANVGMNMNSGPTQPEMNGNQPGMTG